MRCLITTLESSTNAMQSVAVALVGASVAMGGLSARSWNASLVMICSTVRGVSVTVVPSDATSASENPHPCVGGSTACLSASFLRLSV